MDIEDRYGDLQNLYWNSKDGDLILNELDSNIGIVELDNRRIYVKDGNRLLHVEEWLDPNDRRKFQAAIYRPEHPMVKLVDLKKTDLKSKCKLITEIAVEY
jgi:hypothetical protein